MTQLKRMKIVQVFCRNNQINAFRFSDIFSHIASLRILSKLNLTFDECVKKKEKKGRHLSHLLVSAPYNFGLANCWVV